MEQLDPFNALEAKTEAQKLSFAPIVFHTARTLRDLGILKALDEAGDTGLSAQAIHQQTGVSEYGVKVLLDMAISANIVLWTKPHYRLANLGFFLLHDGMTRANMDFTADVCYAAMMHLTEAIEEGKPAGLKELGIGKPFTKGCHACRNKPNRAGSSSTIFTPIARSRFCWNGCLPTSRNIWSTLAATPENGHCNAAAMIQRCR